MQHLGVLERADLVVARTQGRTALERAECRADHGHPRSLDRALRRQRRPPRRPARARPGTRPLGASRTRRTPNDPSIGPSDCCASPGVRAEKASRIERWIDPDLAHGHGRQDLTGREPALDVPVREQDAADRPVVLVARFDPLGRRVDVDVKRTPLPVAIDQPGWPGSGNKATRIHRRASGGAHGRQSRRPLRARRT